MKKKLISYLRNKKRHLIVATLMAIFAITVGYWTMNWSVTLSSEKANLQLLEYIRQQIFGANISHASDSILMVDVHYDKVMVPEHKKSADGTQLELGQVPVTDRDKLLRLLKQLQLKKDYRYVILDVRLEESTSQSEDSALWQTISEMPRLVLANPVGTQIASPILNKKTAAAQYQTALWETDFVKYPFYADTIPSMALTMYREITGHDIQRQGPLWMDGYQLSRRSILLTWDFSDYRERFYLGDLLEELGEGDEEDWAGNPSGKYILIGDFEDDIHPTFLGEIPGTLLIYNAFSSLLHKRHVLSLSFLFLLFCIYFALAWLTLSHNSRFKWICSFLGYTGFLFIVSIITYLAFNEVYDILITALLFTGLNKIVGMTNSRNKIKQYLVRIKKHFSK
ncbi:hypothetical protein SAMN04487900_103165 [Prevotella communis]|uniref:CHASE2 domain-containing protein n=1 Tax=Prevotella communis TaxID=2913614 RepID=A0A1H0EH84_9BACT|nr:CHASE2 domain-containing protein [Prevotella communis]SDN81784.1 hypothetical protein SAMN04487900_103165 [Prevotella communis]